MGIRDDAKKIAQRMLDIASNEGTFRKFYLFNRKDFEKDLNITRMRCRLCFEYLEAIGCIRRSPDAEPGRVPFKVMPEIVDFIECDRSVF